jgi:hypothetical protein
MYVDTKKNTMAHVANLKMSEIKKTQFVMFNDHCPTETAVNWGGLTSRYLHSHVHTPE